MTSSSESTETRIESDSLGTMEIPAAAFWGIHTARALENFEISGIPLAQHRDLIRALGLIKAAAARTNKELGVLDPSTSSAVEASAMEVADGLHDEHFVVDVIQGGAGTSTNMNVNEVIANRALQLLGKMPGDYATVNPIDHVNRSQSTNDVYPTGVRIALASAIERLAQVLVECVDVLNLKADEYDDVVKIGRTQLQDAVPMTVGQEFRAWAVTLSEELPRLRETRALLVEVNLGATAIGTGINAHADYSRLVCEHLAELTGAPIVPAVDLIEATSDTGAFVLTSSTLKRVAIKLSKISNDLRLLASGPQAGLGELALPPRQAGSSIMPGKVNPVIPEVVNQVAFAICGNDVTVTMAAEAGQLQLNAFEPVMAHRLLEGFSWLTHAIRTLTENCLIDISVNRARLQSIVSENVGVVTALAPAIGYALAAQIAKASLRGEGTVRELVSATGLISADDLDEQLSPSRLSGSAPVGSDPHAGTLGARALVHDKKLRW